VSRRALAVLWLVLGVAVWNGFFDIYVSRGAHEYVKLVYKHELGRGPEPDADVVTGHAKRGGAIAATIWATIVMAAGWGTIWASSKFKVRSSNTDQKGD
jgi:hypothetical protein